MTLLEPTRGIAAQLIVDNVIRLTHFSNLRSKHSLMYASLWTQVSFFYLWVFSYLLTPISCRISAMFPLFLGSIFVSRRILLYVQRFSSTWKPLVLVESDWDGCQENRRLRCARMSWWVCLLLPFRTFHLSSSSYGDFVISCFAITSATISLVAPPISPLFTLRRQSSTHNLLPFSTMTNEF